jgi:hypothetical protein
MVRVGGCPVRRCAVRMVADGSLQPVLMVEE